MVRRNKRRKEEIAEDWCFVCKDGGKMRVCDFRDCLKTYHPHCVGEEDSFLETDNYWTCALHFCFLCRKASKFKCFCCPTAVCGRCIYDAEFAIVKGMKGLCSYCAKLALLIEENADVDSDGEKIDFKNTETYECLFSEYYEIIKEKEGLNSLHVHSAHNILKNGKNYKCDLDLNEIGEGEDDTGESEDGSNFIVSDYDDLNDTAGVKSVRKKKRCMRKLKSIKGKVKDQRREYIGWGSKSLIEFLKYIGRDTSREFSEHEVASIIIEYCKENKLFDPKKKRKVLCDAQLRSLLGRKSVNRNNIQNLLAPHFAENFEEMEDDITSSSEDRDDNQPFKRSSQRKLMSSTKSQQNLVSEEHHSCFAAIVRSNLKLVYLKRSLVEELLKQPETFDGKVMGSFVRVKSDPNDYLQKNSHLLLQVVGINRSSKNDEINKEILLQLSNVPKDIPICKISDDDFSEEECQDLYQRMRNGLLKQPTILELEQKASSLHEDIIKHWIPRELALLQNRIDQANEKGWRRELSEYMDRKLKLQTPSEQSRLLSDIPKLIPEIVDNKLSPESSPRKDRLEQNVLPELAMGETCNSVGRYSKHSGFARCLHNTTTVADVTFFEDTPFFVTSATSDSTPSQVLPIALFTTFVSNPQAPQSQDDHPLHRFGITYERRNPKVPEITPTIDSYDSAPALIASPTAVPPGNSADLPIALRKGRKTTVKRGQDGTALSASVEQLSEELSSDSQTLNPAKRCLHQRRNTESGSVIDGRKLNAMNAKPTIKEKQNTSVADPIEASANDKKDTSISDIPMGEKVVSISNLHVIELSDSDEQDVNIADISAGRKVMENPEIPVWNCLGPFGVRSGPYSMSVLKRWNETASYPLEFKVWKTGQSETEAILLTDALRQIFPSK